MAGIGTQGCRGRRDPVPWEDSLRADRGRAVPAVVFFPCWTLGFLKEEAPGPEKGRVKVHCNTVEAGGSRQAVALLWDCHCSWGTWEARLARFCLVSCPGRCPGKPTASPAPQSLFSPFPAPPSPEPFAHSTHAGNSLGRVRPGCADQWTPLPFRPVTHPLPVWTGH